MLPRNDKPARVNEKRLHMFIDFVILISGVIRKLFKIMDFKKFASDAGTFFNRAKQVKRIPAFPFAGNFGKIF